MKPSKEPQSQAAAVRRRTGGRSAKVLSSVADAVMAELVESGVEEFSIPRVAARAELHTSSIYRRWPNKWELISFAGASLAESMNAIPDCGSLRSDLLRMLEDGAKFVRDPRIRILIALGFSNRNSEEDQRARTSYWQQRLLSHQAIFDRALARGEIAPDADTEEILERTIGALYARAFISRRPITRDFLQRTVNGVLHQDAAPQPAVKSVRARKADKSAPQ